MPFYYVKHDKRQADVSMCYYTVISVRIGTKVLCILTSSAVALRSYPLGAGAVEKPGLRGVVA